MQLICSICEEVLKKPVTTPCGHNFCMDCIRVYWKNNVLCQCPQCKEKFPNISELQVNTQLSKMVDEFWNPFVVNNTSPQDQCLDHPREVSRDICVGREVKAVNSSFEASYCETPLEPNQRVTTLRRQQHVENPEEHMCERHGRCLEFKTDYNTHNTLPLEVETRKNNVQLGKAEVQQMIQGRQQKVIEIRNSLQSSGINAEQEVENSCQIFRALMRSIERSQAELIEVISEKQKETKRLAEGLIKELEQEITDLKLLQSSPSLCTSPPTKDWSEIRVQTFENVGMVRKAVKRAGSQFEDALKSELKRLCEAELKVIQQWSVDVTLDPDTAHPNLTLSEDVKQLRHPGRRQNYPSNPERFFYIASILGKEGYSSGRFYYGVQVKGNTLWSLGVARESIKRTIYAATPENGLWTIQQGKGNIYRACTTDPTPLSLSEKPQTVGVYVDYEDDPDMASASSLLSEDQFLCPICLDVFTSPITTPCGHNFCKDCIHGYWHITSPCQCPMCKQKFSRRPELKVNTFIAEMADQFRRSVEIRATATSTQYQPQAAQPGEVPCDVCTGRKIKALKSCLECLASYCETHLDPHHILATFKKHNLIEPVINIEHRVCKRHQKILELFCRSDQTYMCQVCTEKRHKKHNVVSLEEESRERRAQLGNMEDVMQQMIQGRLQKVKEIKHTVQSGKINAEREIRESLQVFTALVRSIQRSQAELIEVIEEKQKAAENRAEGLIKELEQEITELKRRSTGVKQLSLTEDHLHLIHSFPFLCTPPPAKDWSDIRVQSVVYVGTVRRAVRRAGSQFEETLKNEVKRLCETELTRTQQCAVDVTLDPDTAHPKLILSDNGKQVAHGNTALNLPDNPERFYPGISVLGREGFSSGRFYYEVQVKGKTEWDIGVGRESVNKKGGNTLNPEHGYWTVGLRNRTEYWALTTPPVPLPLVDKPQRVGVYVDWEGGQVSFYDVDSRSHIYSFTGYIFAERLYAYFNPRKNNGGVNSAPLVISPVSDVTSSP